MPRRLIALAATVVGALVLVASGCGGGDGEEAAPATTGAEPTLRVGLITEQCPHRRASLAFGIPTQDGIRCPYHGWEFGHDGGCLSQPNEPEKSQFRHKVRTRAYPVEEMGGMFWAYLGPADKKPLLPRIDGFVTEGTVRMLGRTLIPVNWLQIMENSLDPIHTEWLHGHTYEFIKEQQGQGHKVAISARHDTSPDPPRPKTATVCPEKEVTGVINAVLAWTVPRAPAPPR